jgi:hypothetical protein
VMAVPLRAGGGGFVTSATGLTRRSRTNTSGGKNAADKAAVIAVASLRM